MGRNAALVNKDSLKLGLFGANCSRGRTFSTVPECWDASWEHTVALAKLADDVGIECMVPIGRWKGYGGITNPAGSSYESITWACGLLAETRHINALATVHVPLIHPVLAAKQMATTDLVGKGRFAVNVVCGQHEDEFQMFGIRQLEHDERYVQGEEWWTVIRKIWEGEPPFDFDGKYFHLRGVEGSPRPYGGQAPLMMNAATSPAGRAWGIRFADMHFTSFHVGKDKEQIAEAKQVARDLGREIHVWGGLGIVCRPTLQEAKDFVHYVVEHADSGAMGHLTGRAERPGADVSEGLYERQVIASGTQCVFGEPDAVAAELARIHAVGFDGLMISFVNYLDELPYFAQEVLPRLEKLGVRSSFFSASAPV